MAVLRVPRITTADRVGLVLAESEIVYDTTDKYFYGGDGTTSGGVAVGSGFSFNCEVIEVTPAILSAKQFQLLKPPTSSVVLIPEGGPAQIQGVDFSVSPLGIVSWNGLGLDGFVDLGDLFIVQY